MILEYEALQQEVVHQARTDPLTGLLNRRAFIEAVHRDIARLDRAAESGTLMFVDLDSFKSVNDRLGHGAGRPGAGSLRRPVCASWSGRAI